MPGTDLRAARANRVFCTDKKHPYRKRGYSEKQGRRGFLYKIVDCARMAFLRAQSAVRADAMFVRATWQPCNNGGAIQVATYAG
jgi:hypothetical protein